jgi:hypothetical protein
MEAPRKTSDKRLARVVLARPSRLLLGNIISRMLKKAPLMITRQRPIRLRSRTRLVSAERRSVASDRAGRLIQVALALYLIPALLAVLAVGCLGMLILGIGRLFTARVRTSCS